MAYEPRAYASSYPKNMKGNKNTLLGMGVVNGRLVIESKGDSTLELPAGTLVCEPWTEKDQAALSETELENDGGLASTVTRFGIVFHDQGVFTERV